VPEGYTITPPEEGPPFYDQADEAALRERFGLEPLTEEAPRRSRWRCLVADPSCGFTFELNAMGAYARRFRQGAVDGSGGVESWNTARAQYDLWLNFPTVVEHQGRAKWTRMTLGPKGGLVASDTGSLFGTVGLALRYWLGKGRVARGAFAPAIEASGALSFGLLRRPIDPDTGERTWVHQRAPVGFTADVGFGLGGFGALVVGAQYESPLDRDEIAERFRVRPGGMVFVGFRGNVLWGAPAAVAVTAHAVAERTVDDPTSQQ
jgi:hypothetical protein